MLNQPHYSIIRLFYEYYTKNFPSLTAVINDLKFRHIRVQLFSKHTRFERIKDNITSHEQLVKKVTKIIPMNLYFTPVKWLNPIYVSHKKSEIDVMLSYPLYFDIDKKDLEPPTLIEAKNNTCSLVEYIYDQYNIKPSIVLFSGRQGFHIHYFKDFLENFHSLLPTERIESFTVNRKKIIEELSENKIIVDESVTADPFRILKYPNSLHGKTGLIASPINDLDLYDPIKESLAFDEEVYQNIFDLDLNKLEL